jgi:nitrogen fixation protein FixH
MTIPTIPTIPTNLHEAMTPERRQAERRAALTWGAIIIGILGASFTVAMVMLYVSSTDPSFAVEPDYYDKAIHWDDHATQRQTNTELGWRITLGQGPGGAPGQRTLTAILTDRAGDPIGDATVGVVAFHNARAADRSGFPMTTTGGGVFTAEAPLRRPGLWEFRFTVVAPGSTFTDTQQIELPPIPGAGTAR